MVIKIITSCFLICILSGAGGQVTNQHLFDTASFMPDHNTERVARFENEAVVKGRIIFFGNSITEGGKWQELTGDNTVVNRGIGGDITFNLLNRLDDVIKRQPVKLFILIGINDIGKDIPDEVIADNYKKIITRVQRESPATKIYVQSILPLNNTVIGFPQHYNKPEHVISTNRLLQAMAAGMNCTFINLYPLFLGEDKRLNKKYTVDGLHLRPEGYALWVKYLKQKKYL